MYVYPEELKLKYVSYTGGYSIVPECCYFPHNICKCTVPTIVEHAIADPGLSRSTLVTALKAANIVDTQVRALSPSLPRPTRPSRPCPPVLSPTS
jgi:hypothetical protein